MKNKGGLIVGGLILFGVFIVVFINGNSGGSITNLPNSQQADDVFSVQISNKTGESTSDIKNALAIAGRYDLNNDVVKVVVDNAAMVSSMRSSGTNSAQLQFLGFGDFMQTADTFAQIAKAWNFDNSTAQHNFDVLFNATTQSLIKWPQYNAVLIKNGPKLRDYTSFIDAASYLSVSPKYFSEDTAIEIFNRIGDAAANPSDKMNVALGGSEHIRGALREGGMVRATEIISSYIKQNSN